ncbi:MAG: hypothetical protein FWG74_09980 [Planctomycetes bacterium]|nr:hypothetical protein [Planctomycetota bacterium]
MTTTQNRTTKANPNAWSFVCGRMAALESELLPRSFFETLLKCGNRAEARSVLGKSNYRILFPDDKSLDSVSSILDAKTKEMKADFFKSCPPHPLLSFFDIGYRFRTFRTLFNQACRQSNPPVAELENLFGLFEIEPKYANGLREHRCMLSRSNPPQTASSMERSLFLDSVACSFMSVLSEDTPESLVKRYMRDRAVLSAWSGIFRLRWNGVPAEMIRRWFIFENSFDLAASILATENDPKATVIARLSTQSAMIMESVDVQRIKIDIDSVSSDVLRDMVLTCRMVPFGAERAMSYLLAAEVELVNLELCLSAIGNGIDRDITLSRLRREYA